MEFVKLRNYLTTSNLAFTFTPSAHPEQWALIFAYADLQRLPEADFKVDGRAYGFFGHDWRTVPPRLDLLPSARSPRVSRRPCRVPPGRRRSP